MKTASGHLSYCSNIHPGEDWAGHFTVLRDSIPVIKEQISPDKPMGIGLRLANQATLDLFEDGHFRSFKEWLKDEDCYVFTMNGFPYGGFHNTVVKDQVHAPDWTTQERLDYTLRMFSLLNRLLPATLETGGISTSPISYRFWWNGEEELQAAIRKGTENMVRVASELNALRVQSGKILHLDIEPEPDGILENSFEFISWYNEWLIPVGLEMLGTEGMAPEIAEEVLRTHIRLCYDVCHFAVSYEEPEAVIRKMNAERIQIGKIQISSALRIDFSEREEEKIHAISGFDEPVYLHQVVALKKDGGTESFKDLGPALEAFEPGKYKEWRIHFHVPLFMEDYGALESTQSEIIKTLEIQRKEPFTEHLEVETYTWGVLPEEIQLPLNESISREMLWVKQLL